LFLKLRDIVTIYYIFYIFYQFFGWCLREELRFVRFLFGYVLCLGLILDVGLLRVATFGQILIRVILLAMNAAIGAAQHDSAILGNGNFEGSFVGVEPLPLFLCLIPKID
jgi:hypothetical protein